MAVVYLLHFDKPFQGTKRNPNAKRAGFAAHYVGYAENLTKRIAHHQTGTGANLTKYAAQAGITFIVARTWENGTRETERAVKKSKHHSRLCPLCNPNALRRGQKVFNAP